jgi:hypothetical protein
VIDEQAQRSARRRPAARDQLIGVVRASTGNLKGQVEVEVALSPGLAGTQPPVAAPGAGAEAPGAHEQPRGEPPRLDPQLRIGGRAEVGEQRDGGVGVGAQEVVEGLLVEPADGR